MKMSDKWQEECAVFAVSVHTGEAAQITYNGLLSLQHRGQEGAGIAVLAENGIKSHKDIGLVNEAFSGGALDRLPPSGMAVGHNRYSTTGNSIRENVQPFVTEYLTGRIATVHNGNITNAAAIRTKLKSKGLNFHATSDSEVIASLVAYYSLQKENPLAGVISAAEKLEGAFSLIIMSNENKLIAVRDAYGYRPLCIGENEAGLAVASESCALESCGFSFVRDILPGEVVVITDGRITYQKIHLQPVRPACGICIFEYVYFARQDSLIDGQSVYEARYRMGQILAREYPVAADVVCGVPDSGLEAAMGYCEASGIPLASGFVKNRYIGRSFIYPTQAQRDNAVQMKLNPLSVNIRGKRVVLVDDSIVRGTTSAQIVQSLKRAGAKEVHMRISSPPFRYSCHYGTDIDSEDKLIANQMSIEEIGKKIGADSLGFISVEGLKKACGDCRIPFCTHCFTGGRQ